MVTMLTRRATRETLRLARALESESLPKKRVEMLALELEGETGAEEVFAANAAMTSSTVV